MCTGRPVLRPARRLPARAFLPFLALVTVVGALAIPTPASSDAGSSPHAEAEVGGVLHDAREVRLAEVRQLTFAGENAEAYWSFDGSELIFQSTAPPYACDQIFRMRPDRPGEKTLVSTGTGRTTCAYFLPGDDQIVYASTHATSTDCPPRPDYSRGYVWPIYDTYEIYRAARDGSDLVALTDNEVYDAEATVCPVDGSMVFTSMRDGDLDLYRMDADGGNVTRLTDTPGYDGGAFFNQDCTKIVWRASRPSGKALEDYRALLAEGLVRPSKLEIFVAEADGSEARQLTYLDAGTFAPFFHPSGDRVLFSTNAGDPRGREFDIWAIDVDGTDLEQITFTEGFDGFPMFSPDGQLLAFASNRNQGKPGETDVYVARWLEAPATPPVIVETPADRYRADVAWLADDAREGRGVGTRGLGEATAWLETRFAELGLEAAGSDGYRQAFQVVVQVEAGSSTSLEIDGVAVAAEAARPASFATNGTVEAEVVAVGYGISAPELGHDDYHGLDVDGKVVAVRRFVPAGDTFADDRHQRRFGDLRYKAWNAREHGAVGVVIVDWPPLPDGEPVPEEVPLPRLGVDREGEAGLPVFVAQRAAAAILFDDRDHRARLEVELVPTRAPTHNVVGRFPAAGEPLGGPVVIGAHYDHLGLGGRGSLAPDEQAPHNGADDNASGTAGLLEIARIVGARQAELRRDVWIVAFSGEESGLIGSTYFTKNPPAGLALDSVLAMINLDMIGRLRRNTIAVLGAGSAEEWSDLLEGPCDHRRLICSGSGDGYGPSDQTPFFAAGIPVLHFFSGAHGDYHRPSDDIERVNAAGGARVAGVVADLALVLAQHPSPLTYVRAEAPAPRGDSRSYGASLGTIPDYADENGGVLLAGVRPGSAAEQAGMQRGDRLVELSGHAVGDIYDFMFVLRQSKPGETTTAVVERGGERLTVEITFGSTSRLR